MGEDATDPRLSRAKQIGLVVIAIFGTWALWPESESAGDAGSSGFPRTSFDDAKYVIKFSPGNAYFPDSHPYGMGEPLQGMKKVVAAFEKRFPDTRIEVLNTPRVREYLVTQLSGGRAPDIINVNVEDVWTDVHKGWYVPLDGFLESPNEFIAERGDESLPGSKQWWDMFRYQAISRGKAAPDGLVYNITYDMVETGIYYNKTVFRELGLTVPRTWSELIENAKRIKQTGRIPLVMHMGAFHDWLKDLLFDQLYYDLLPGIDLDQDPVREPYLQGYLDWHELAFLRQKGFFNSEDKRYVRMWELMRELKTYTNQDLVSTDTVREFINQKATMVWHVSSLSHRLNIDKKLGFEWGVFYLPMITKDQSKYASMKPMCVIGGAATQLEVTNRAVNDTDPALPMAERVKKSSKLKRVIQFLQFMCVPEQYERIVCEYPGLVPNIRGVEVLPLLKPFEEILERRYTTTKWVFSFDLRFSEIQQRMLVLYLTDGIDLDEFLSWQERNLEAACSNLVRRKNLDWDALEAAWRDRANKRRTMVDLPDGVRKEFDQ